MKRRIRENEKKYLIYMVIFTAAAGFINGFIGTGGGIILYFALKYSEKFGGGTTELRNRLAGTIFIIIPISAVSAAIYSIKGNIDIKSIGIYIPAAIIGGFCGALCLNKLKPMIIRRIFAAFLIIGGLRMIIPL